MCRGGFRVWRGAVMRCGRSGHARFGVRCRVAGSRRPSGRGRADWLHVAGGAGNRGPVPLRTKRWSRMSGPSGNGPYIQIGMDARKEACVRKQQRAKTGARGNGGVRRPGRVETVACETGRRRRAGAKRGAACQYMFSYMDCDLSYFRSESDAALTPMLKLHER